MKRTLAASGVFILYVLTGGVWVSLGSLLPDGVPRAIVTIAMAFLFVAMFLWLFVSRLRRLLGDDGNWVAEIALALVNVGLLLAAFATLQQRIGVVDTTQEGSPVVTDFLSCAYFSLVTFTTLGYGDLHPQGIGRTLAVLEAFTGYLILGVLASTAATLISPREEPGPFDGERFG